MSYLRGSTSFKRLPSVTLCRFFASGAKGNNSGVAVASFPIETYVNTNGITWKTTLKPAMRDIGWLDTPELEREELHKDASAILKFVSPPLSHLEDTEAAARRKVNAFYRANGTELGDPKSVWTVKFFPQQPAHTLEDFVEERMKSFFLYTPAGTVSTITLHPTVLAGVSQRGVFTSAMYYNKKHAYVYGEDSGLAQFGQMSLYVRTASGVWDISWHALASLLKRRKDLFVSTVRQVSLSVPEQRVMTAKPLPVPVTFTPDL